MVELLTLNEIGLKNKSDKSSEYHDYLNLYDKYFYAHRNKNINFLEIGILFGDSLKIFDEYFVNANITAIDIEDKSHLSKSNIEIIKGDQSDRNLLNGFEDNKFDIILDDGSHNMVHQQISLGALFKKLKSGGLYVVEDLHTSYHEYRENIMYNNRLFGLTNDNSTVDFLNGITNKINKNKYLTTEEYEYLCENIESIEIFETSRKNNNEFSITSIIKKK
jgi:ubiquinone/menaquinone biosynthesis C-methylase UbiE